MNKEFVRCSWWGSKKIKNIITDLAPSSISRIHTVYGNSSVASTRERCGARCGDCPSYKGGTAAARGQWGRRGRAPSICGDRWRQQGPVCCDPGFYSYTSTSYRTYYTRNTNWILMIFNSLPYLGCRLSSDSVAALSSSDSIKSIRTDTIQHWPRGQQTSDLVLSDSDRDIYLIMDWAEYGSVWKPLNTLQ